MSLSDHEKWNWRQLFYDSIMKSIALNGTLKALNWCPTHILNPGEKRILLQQRTEDEYLPAWEYENDHEKCSWLWDGNQSILDAGSHRISGEWLTEQFLQPLEKCEYEFIENTLSELKTVLKEIPVQLAFGNFTHKTVLNDENDLWVECEDSPVSRVRLSWDGVVSSPGDVELHPKMIQSLNTAIWQAIFFRVEEVIGHPFPTIQWDLCQIYRIRFREGITYKFTDHSDCVERHGSR